MTHHCFPTRRRIQYCSRERSLHSQWEPVLLLGFFSYRRVHWFQSLCVTTSFISCLKSCASMPGRRLLLTRQGFKSHGSQHLAEAVAEALPQYRALCAGAAAAFPSGLPVHQCDIHSIKHRQLAAVLHKSRWLLIFTFLVNWNHHLLSLMLPSGHILENIHFAIWRYWYPRFSVCILLARTLAFS